MANPCLGVPRNSWCPNNKTNEPPYPVPGSPSESQPSGPPPCEFGNEDNGNGRVADENGNNGGNFSDDECNGALNFGFDRVEVAEPPHPQDVVGPDDR